MTAAACRQVIGDGAGSYLHHMVWGYNQSEVSIDFVNQSEVSIASSLVQIALTSCGHVIGDDPVSYVQHLVRTCNQSEVSIM